MAQEKPDLIGKLTGRGEDVVGRITDFPAAQRLADAAAGFKELVDDLQRRLRGVDELEKRVAALEKKVDRLVKPAGGAKRSTAKRTTASRAKKT
jgi:uncharacterized small protein (DUF1192 family)